MDPQSHYELMHKFIHVTQFERMVFLDAKVTRDFKTYSDLKQWTLHCLNDMSLGDSQFLINYVRMLSKKPLWAVDMDSCAEFPLINFYYNRQKEICLVMAR